MTLLKQSQSLLHALDTWQQLWGRALEQLADEDRKWLGVANNVSDLAHLTRRIIEVSIGPQAASSRYLQRIPSFGTKELHQFMREFGSDG
jgi:hypothetical protein